MIIRHTFILPSSQKTRDLQIGDTVVAFLGDPEKEDPAIPCVLVVTSMSTQTLGPKDNPMVWGVCLPPGQILLASKGQIPPLMPLRCVWADSLKPGTFAFPEDLPDSIGDPLPGDSKSLLEM